jgi:hypothetical protein
MTALEQKKKNESINFDYFRGVYWIEISKDFKILFYGKKISWYSIKIFTKLKRILWYSIKTIKIFFQGNKIFWYSIQISHHF